MNVLLRKAMRVLGFNPRKSQPSSDPEALPPDLSSQDCDILRRISTYTMTSIDRQISLIQSVRHLVKHNIQGCFVECGVWRGGSSMAMALTLAQEGSMDRDLYLYDTFEGMTPPTDSDRTADGTLAQIHLDRDVNKSGSGYWCIAGKDDVKQNMDSTGYPKERYHLIQGPVEKTISQEFPYKKIALLRLDTDWYESTKHELNCLFPLLCEGGILIIDDYGHWEGARKAVDEYLSKLDQSYFLHRIDYTGRLLVKSCPGSGKERGI